MSIFDWLAGGDRGSDADSREPDLGQMAYAIRTGRLDPNEWWAATHQTGGPQDPYGAVAEALASVGLDPENGFVGGDALNSANNAVGKTELERFMEFYNAMTGGGGGGGGGGPSAAMIQAAVDKINEDYDRQLGMLTGRRDQGATSIANALQTFRSNTAANNSQYNAASQQISDAIAARLAQSMAQAEATRAEAAKQADALGWNGAAIQANAANNTTALQNSIRYQQDLSDRYRQVQGSSQNQTANAGELVNQGATNRLTTGYQDTMNALEQSRSDAVYSARNQSSGAGGGGGGGGSRSSNFRDIATAYDLYGKLFGGNEVDPQTAYLYKMFEADPNGFAANPEYQKYLPQMGDIAARQYTSKMR